MLRTINLRVSARAKSIAAIIFKILISAVLVIYLVNRISVTKLIEAFDSLNYLFFSVGVLLSILNIYSQYIRWRYILKIQNTSVSKLDVIKSLFTGYSAGIITPIRVGEYLGRKIPLKEFTVTEIITMTVLDKFSLLLNVVFWGGITSIFFLSFYYKVSYLIVSSLFVLFSFFFYLIFLLLFSKKFYLHIQERRKNIKVKFKVVHTIVQQIDKLESTSFLKLTLLALFNYIILVVQFAVLVLTFESNGGYFYFILCSVLMFFAKTLVPSVTFGEIGIRESASVYFLGIYGVSEAAAFNAALMLFFLNLLLPSLIGLYFIIKSKFNFAS